MTSVGFWVTNVYKSPWLPFECDIVIWLHWVSIIKSAFQAIIIELAIIPRYIIRQLEFSKIRVHLLAILIYHPIDIAWDMEHLNSVSTLQFSRHEYFCWGCAQRVVNWVSNLKHLPFILNHQVAVVRATSQLAYICNSIDALLPASTLMLVNLVNQIIFIPEKRSVCFNWCFQLPDVAFCPNHVWFEGSDIAIFVPIPKLWNWA